MEIYFSKTALIITITWYFDTPFQGCGSAYEINIIKLDEQRKSTQT